jgi:farnesyl-diphosphate farnesyltransferase
MPCPIASVAPHEAWTFCHAILPDVSRTFALNIPVLPPSLRDAVCCAYLLCRIADTIEDTEPLDEPLRAGLYDALHRAVRPDDPKGDAFERTSWTGTAPAAYARLVAGAPLVLAAYATLSRAQREPIAACVREMIAGMRTLGGRPRDGGVRFICDDLVGLDRYCHFVAGTVGIMLTRLFAAELGDSARLASRETLERGRRFGLGLQAVNIIKDHADDIARGTCFVPRMCVDASAPDRAIRAECRADLIRHALAHLDEAMQFALAVPSHAEGIRLFCLWALMLALGTLREAARPSARTPKVERAEVATILSESRRWVADDAALRQWYESYRAQVVRAVDGIAAPADGRRRPDGASPA